MKKIWLTMLLFTHPVFSIDSPVSKNPSQSTSTPTTPPPQAHPVHARPKLIIAPSEKTIKTPQALAGDLFYYPGVVTAADGRWTGGDNFLNLSKTIALQVNFIKTEKLEISFKLEKLQAAVAPIFEEAGFVISNASSGTKPPLPFFNVVVLIFQTSDGFAAACQGRLFEEVEIPRVHLKEGVFQGITWEQTNVVFGPEENFEKLLTNTIESIAKNFVSRVSRQQSANKP